MSDKETAQKWLNSRGLGDLSLYWPTNKPIPQIDYESGQAQPALTQLMADFAVECRAPAPQIERFGDWCDMKAIEPTMGQVDAFVREQVRAATPQVTPWKSHFTDSDVSGDIHNYVDTGDGKRLWAQDADEIVKRHNEQAPQVTPRFSERYGRCDYSSTPHEKDSKMVGPCLNWKALSRCTPWESNFTNIIKAAKRYCKICDEVRSDDSDAAVSLRRNAFMELSKACNQEGTSEQAPPSPDKCPKCGSGIRSVFGRDCTQAWHSSWHSSAATPKGTTKVGEVERG